MHRLDHRVPIPLKKEKQKKAKNKVRLQWQCAQAELLACLYAVQSHSSASAAGDLQAQMIWGGLVYPHTSVSTAACTRVAPFPIASDNLETFWAVNHILISFFCNSNAPMKGQW